MTKRKTVLRLVSMLTAFVLFLMGVPWVKPEIANAEQEMYGNFSKNYSYSSDPGQYMLNIAKAQTGKTRAQLGYTVDWCAYFIADCAVLANQTKAIPRHGRADYIDEYILNAGGVKVSVSSARAGDIAFYDNNYNNSPDHVEIVSHVSGSNVYTIGGNNGDGNGNVAGVRCYGNILYIIRPNYSGVIPPDPVPDKEICNPYPRPSLSSTHWLGDGTVGGVTGVTRGDEVKWLQYALNTNFGYDIGSTGVDGVLGAKTTAAIKSFQSKYGLTVDGYFGVNSLNKMVSVIKSNNLIKHNYGSWSGSAATCTSAGSQTRNCSRCGASETKNTAALGHNMGAWSEKAATCTADGSRTRKCSRCSYSESQTIAKTGHSLGNWTTSKAATCTADGTSVRKCSKCSYSESKTIPKTGHSLGDWTTSKAATCTADGTQVRKCSKCTYSESKTIAKTGHSLGNWTTSKAATCTADGTQVRKCSKCSYSEEKAIAKTGHKYTDKIVAPTCTEKGYTKHTCSVCKDSYNDKETNAKGHTFTSKKIGNYMTYICSDCGFMYTAPFEGEGTAESPFIISNADELRAVSDTVNNTELNQIFGHAYYKQTADIDLENISWTPIGLGYDGEDGRGAYNCNTRMFFGVYDGDQHTIYNLNVENHIQAGLFGCVRNDGAEVCNLVVYGIINSDGDSGGITGGLHYGAEITNCAFIGNVKGDLSVGGITGYINGGASIINCYHNGNVTGGNNMGGIVGEAAFNKYANDNASAIIENCYHANGEVTGKICGAVVGNCSYFDGKNNTITIKNCYASKSSTYSDRNEKATYDDTMVLPNSLLKEIAEDLGDAYIDNTNPELNNSFPVFPWQLDIMRKGDADNNGIVNVNDAIMLQDWLLGSGKLINWENVDLCEDGVIDVFDLCLLRRLLVENAE